MQGPLLLTLPWLQPSALPPPAVDTRVSPENRWDVAQLVPALLRGIPQVSMPTPGASADTRVDVCLLAVLGRDGCTRGAFPCEGQQVLSLMSRSMLSHHPGAGTPRASSGGGWGVTSTFGSQSREVSARMFLSRPQTWAA